MIRVTIWNEHVQDREEEAVMAVYPKGIHTALAEAFAGLAEFHVRTTTLQDPEQGLAESLLDETDVLIWWGHRAHQQVEDRYVERIEQRVRQGMGFIALHSAHFSKPFIRLMGTGCKLKWRNDGRRERVWTVDPAHPIAAGLGEFFDVPQEEMYGEPFDVPTPDQLVFISWFEGGEVFRSGCVWKHGAGRIFYFRPGHETYPVYYQPEIRTILVNAAKWLGQSATQHNQG